MSVETIKKIILSSLECNKEDKIHILFMGGEPTLCLNNIKTIMNDLKKKRSYGRLYFSLQTNGIGLDETKLKLMKKINLHTSLSIDGFTPEHNKLRFGKNSEKYTEEIISKLPLLSKYSINIIATLHKFNHLDIRKIYDFYNNHKIQIKFNYLISELDDDFLLAPEQVSDAYKKLGNKSSFLTKLRRIQENQDLNYMWCDRYPCGAGINTFGFDVNGDIYPCNRVIRFNDLRLGNIKDISVKEARQIFSNKYLNELKRPQKTCDSCYSNRFCNRGCLLQRKIENKSKSEYVCKIMKLIGRDIINKV